MREVDASAAHGRCAVGARARGAASKQARERAWRRRGRDKRGDGGVEGTGAKRGRGGAGAPAPAPLEQVSDGSDASALLVVGRAVAAARRAAGRARRLAARNARAAPLRRPRRLGPRAALRRPAGPAAAAAAVGAAAARRAARRLRVARRGRGGRDHGVPRRAVRVARVDALEVGAVGEAEPLEGVVAAAQLLAAHGADPRHRRLELLDHRVVACRAPEDGDGSGG